MLFTSLLPCSSSASFLTSLRISWPGMVLPIIGWFHPHQSSIKKMPYRLAYGQSCGDVFPTVVSSSQMTLSYVKLTHQGANQLFTEFPPGHIRLPGKNGVEVVFHCIFLLRKVWNFYLLYMLLIKVEVLRELNRHNCSGSQATTTQMF